MAKETTTELFFEQFAKQLNKEYKNDNFIRRADVIPQYRRLKSGALMADFVLYGGLPYGRITQSSGMFHSGKAQPLTALVLTPTGYRKMGDIKVGDQVFGADGKIHKVIGVFPQGEKPIYKVTFNDRTSTECSDEHLWNIARRVKSRGYAYEKDADGNLIFDTVPLSALINQELKAPNKGKYLYKIPSCKPLEFAYKETPIDPYLLGCLLGDGSLQGTRASITNIDADILNNISDIIKKTYNYKLSRVPGDIISYYIVPENWDTEDYSGYYYIITYNGKTYNGISQQLLEDVQQRYPEITALDTLRILCREITKGKSVRHKNPSYTDLKEELSVKVNPEKKSPCSRDKLAETLKELKLNTAAEYKHIPEIYLYNDEATRLSILQGLMDTDGYVSKIGESEFQSVSQALADNVAFLIQSFGGRCTKTSYIGRYKDAEGNIHLCKRVYSVRNIKFPTDLPLFRCSRKAVRWDTKKENTQPRYNLRAITSIEYLRNDLCQCILVDSDEHLYLTNDCIVTHNTTGTCAFLAAYQKENPDKKCVYFDVEHSLDLQFQTLMNGLDPEKLFIVSPPAGMSGEQVLGTILEMQTKVSDIGMIIVDSVPALVTSANLNGEFEDDKGMRGTIAKYLHKFCPEILASVQEKGNIVHFINQARITGYTRGPGGSQIPVYGEYGGTALGFYTSVSMRFGTRKFMKDGEVLSGTKGDSADGFRIIFQITKNKTAAVNRGGGYITYSYINGMDKVGDALDMAFTYGYVPAITSRTYQLINPKTGEAYVDENGKEIKGYAGDIKKYLLEHEDFCTQYLEVLTEAISASNTRVNMLSDEDMAAMDAEEQSCAKEEE